MDDILVVNDNVVLSLGDTAVIPSRVTYENGEIKVDFGDTTYPVERSTIQPEFVTLNKSCVIISYYGEQNRITLVAGCMVDADTMKMKWGPIHEYSEDYIFHDIIGLTYNRFIVVHARVPWWTESDPVKRQHDPRLKEKVTDSNLHYGLGYVNPDLTVYVPKIETIKKDSFGFMDMAQ